MKYRKATKKDMASLAAVEMSSGYHKEHFDFLPMLREQFVDGSWIFCAEDKKEIVGYVVVSQKGEIAYLAVAQKAQGKGLGNILLQYAENYAKKKGLSHIFLDVRKDNDSALHIYKKRGFEIVRTYTKLINKKNIVKLRLEKILP